jgi:hypothetical protein
LFSAILTAFVIESYQMLQEDYSETSARLLSAIFTRLDQGTGSSTVSGIPGQIFVAANSAIALNVLWFFSLLLSIAAVFGGILLKQALREYITWTSISRPREALRLRQLRYESFMTWRIPDLVALLPALVQAAVILFICGLPIFLWGPRPVVAIAVIVAVSLLLAIFTIAFLSPILSTDSPLKSPISWVVIHVINVLLRTLTPGKARSRQRDGGITKHTWKHRDLRLIRDRGKAQNYLWQSLTSMFATWDEHYLSYHLQKCANQLTFRGSDNKLHVLDAFEEIIGIGPRIWPLLMLSSDVPPEAVATIVPGWTLEAGDLKDAMIVRRRIAKLPSPMLSMLGDWLIWSTHYALDSRSSKSNAREIFLSFAVLECLFDAVASDSRTQLLNSWVGLNLHVFENSVEPDWLRVGWEKNPWILRDLILRWFKCMKLSDSAVNASGMS